MPPAITTPDGAGTRAGVEAVVFCGIQSSGKSTFYVARFFATHVRISQDLLRTRHRLTRFLAVCLETRQPFVVDRVNATPEQRRVFLAPSRDAGFRTVAYWFDALPRDALARNERREGRARVPVRAILGTAKRFVPPRAEERFDEVFRVTIDPAGAFVVEPVVPGPAAADAGTTRGSAPADPPGPGLARLRPPG